VGLGCLGDRCGAEGFQEGVRRVFNEGFKRGFERRMHQEGVSKASIKAGIRTARTQPPMATRFDSPQGGHFLQM